MTSVRAFAVVPLCLALAALVQAGCAKASGARADDGPAAGGQTLTGQSDRFVVTGRYEPIVLDEVDHLSRNEDKQVVIHGSSSGVTVDLPPEADTSQPNSRWRLVTESATDHGRLVTFTHETTLAQFSIELPASEAELHYGAFLDRLGGDVMVFAWGENWRSFWGYVTVKPKNP